MRFRQAGGGGFGVVAALAALMTIAATARGELGGKEFDFGLGYSHVSLDGSASPFDSRDGIRAEGRFSWGAGGATSGLRLGVGLSISGFEKSVDDDFVLIDDDDGDVIILDGDEVEALTLITPEFQLSWRQMLGPVEGEYGERRWFVEPGVGLGVVIGQYWVGDTFGWWVETDEDEWDATFGARPFIRAGYASDRLVLGLEASYLFGGDLDFTDAIGGDVEEWYIGVFIGGRW